MQCIRRFVLGISNADVLPGHSISLALFISLCTLYYSLPLPYRAFHSVVLHAADVHSLSRLHDHLQHDLSPCRFAIQITGHNVLSVNLGCWWVIRESRYAATSAASTAGFTSIFLQHQPPDWRFWRIKTLPVGIGYELFNIRG
jgi:hypothetical protein